MTELFQNIGGTLVANKPRLAFGGATFDPVKDVIRLTGQLARVKAAMSDGEWRTLAEIAHASDTPLTTVASRVRDLRKPQFGFYTVNTRSRSGGLWEYQLGKSAFTFGREVLPENTGS